MQRPLVFASVISASLALAGAAWAWGQKAEIEVTVHGHTFHTVAVESRDCLLDYKLSFNAPAEVYSAKAEPRNVYAFRSRIDFQDGKAAPIPVFLNRGAGERVYAYHFDTAPEGCWAREVQKLARLRVEGCRGAGCTPDLVK